MQMNTNKVKGISIILILGIAACMVIHWINLSKKQTGMDRLSNALKEVKMLIPGNRVISFQTNEAENSPRTELYYQTQFILSPAIVHDNSIHDSILFIYKKGVGGSPIVFSDTLSYNETDEFVIMLLKNKS